MRVWGRTCFMLAVQHWKRPTLLRLAASLVWLSALASAQSTSPSAQLNETGHVSIGGRPTPYIIHHLPVASFPQLPQSVQDQLNQRGCLVPQTYQAHRPENVIHGSFERPGSSDWAALCSAHGSVSLLVFFGADPAHPFTLASGQETERLQAHDPGKVLGFDWGLDAASPLQVHDAQAGMAPRPPLIHHDAIADSTIDRVTVYHYYSNGAWTRLPSPD